MKRLLLESCSALAQFQSKILYSYDTISCCNKVLKAHLSVLGGKMYLKMGSW